MTAGAGLSLILVYSREHDPWHNLAVEERLMDCTADVDGGPVGILYLWQNDHTVVIGRHQNAWSECRASLLEQEGGKLARRGSGGGAVYHDLGNLNFSILLPRALHDPARSSRVILEAVRSMGVAAELSGRNDILSGGHKFSGNAFQLTERAGLHHGTLLIATDFEKVSRYLSVPKAKLDAKGIASVRSRITNLGEIEPSVTVERACVALEDAFVQAYGGKTTRLADTGAFEDAAMRASQERLASWGWRYGRTLPFQASLEHRFDWGSVRLEFTMENGTVTDHMMYSDMLDPDFPSLLSG
ncbi:MAG TPA: lipoate--protein ligase, partial [Clostridia bacterium]